MAGTAATVTTDSVMPTQLPCAFDYIEYDGQHGRGMPVVALHGLFGGPENWTSVARDLSQTHRFVALRLPVDGTDQSLDSIRRLSQYVRGFLDFTGMDQVVLVGNSLGGHVAIDVGLAFPGRVARLVLTGSAGLAERSLIGGSFPKKTREFIRQQAAQVFYETHHASDEVIERIYRMLLSRTTVRYLLKMARATRDYSVRHHLPHLTMPTLIVWGADDQITPPDVAEEFHRLIPGSKLTFIAQCGHAPPIERPHQFADEVRGFLSLSPG